MRKPGPYVLEHVIRGVYLGMMLTWNKRKWRPKFSMFAKRSQGQRYKTLDNAYMELVRLGIRRTYIVDLATDAIVHYTVEHTRALITEKKEVA
jgi:hypothetical protein